MKNIHIIPTDKPSRLHNKNGELGNYPSTKLYIEDFKGNQHNSFHIYITSDEEIKEGDYRLNIQRGYFKKSDKEGLRYYNKKNNVFKKIILTTDVDLINDGIQAIDDEFLEWFVKNPSCEEVKVKEPLIVNVTDFGYKIIIPKEEPKQETLEEASKDYIENTMKFSFNSLDTKTQANRMLKCAEFGAKWQAERMYSEEEVINFLGEREDYLGTHPSIFDYQDARDWFEQFKKK
jgi:hypothetical protein